MPLDDWHRPGPTARQRRIDLYIGLLVAAAAVFNVVLVRSMGAFVFGPGLAGELAVFGSPQPVPDSVSQAAYRIVQEALTNTLKHAHASTVDVRIRYLAKDLEIDVADDGRVTAATAAGGMGLIGMRERVAVHDGTIETGPRTGGGYRVRVRLPLQREMAGQA